MPPRNWRLRIEDMLEAITGVAEDIKGMDFAAFAIDRKTRNSVVRELQIIGEAARHIPPDIEARYPEIPWPLMRGMRNILVHEYFGVDPETLWKTAKTNLPPLRPLLRRVLDENP